MSLSYSDYSGVSDDERLNIMDVYNMNKDECDSCVLRDKLLLYENELSDVYVSDDADILSNLDVYFLKGMISAKRKIMSLRVRYKDLYDLCIAMDVEIDDLEDMRLLYEKFSELYVSRCNKGGDKEIMNDILERLSSKKLERDILFKKISDILLRITTLKNIIRSDDVDVEDDIVSSSDTANANVLCFTCNEGDVRYCFTPCGHCFCEKCVSRVNVGSASAVCFMCRSNVYGKIKIYFS